jgi:hypothetical protein
VILPFCLTSRSIASYSWPQNPNRAQSSSGIHFSAMRLRSRLPFRKRSNAPSSLLTNSRIVVVIWFESLRVRLTRHPNSMPAGTLLMGPFPFTTRIPQNGVLSNLPGPVACLTGSYRKPDFAGTRFVLLESGLNTCWGTLRLSPISTQARSKPS